MTAYLRIIDIASLSLSPGPILHSLLNKEDSKAQGGLGLLADIFFSARSAAIPPTGRPVHAPARVVDEDDSKRKTRLWRHGR